MSAYDRIRAEGQAEAKAEGRRLALAKQLQLKFGALGDDARARLEAADEVQLDLWAERILFATTLDAMFAN